MADGVMPVQGATQSTPHFIWLRQSAHGSYDVAQAERTQTLGRLGGGHDRAAGDNNDNGNAILGRVFEVCLQVVTRRNKERGAERSIPGLPWSCSGLALK